MLKPECFHCQKETTKNNSVTSEYVGSMKRSQRPSSTSYEIVNFSSTSSYGLLVTSRSQSFRTNSFSANCAAFSFWWWKRIINHLTINDDYVMLNNPRFPKMLIFNQILPAN
ncbi:hypothetical protein T11_12506 [Trichinella zimbabwensis]|uniref:Uncharacterized protein n=1 Tax=Trichinella zimbabwensis TaxID=268475 RepID=A0A0V1H2R5_9BILA|nr:hypothetical protein T11_12506 [Trichinella zimbabwensis]